MLLPIGADGSPNQLEDWEWEPAVSLSHIMKRGLTVPSRAFTVALKAKDPSISCVTLGFTLNNYVVFGLSIDDEGAMPENMDRAKALLRALAEKFGGVRGWIGVEMPTPLTGTPDRSDLILHTWKAESWE